MTVGWIHGLRGPTVRQTWAIEPIHYLFPPCDPTIKGDYEVPQVPN